MQVKKPKFWDKKYKTFFSLILMPFAFLYQIAIIIKKLSINKKKFPIPVLCVGNIYIGGTGKTPLSIKIWELFKNDFKPVIIKKNYKSHKDEIDLIRKYSKVIVTNKRSEGISEAIKKDFNLTILDDGFQDIEIIKNLNIICFNNYQEIGNGLTIPAGPLRESLKSLKNCEVVVINGKKNLEFEGKLKKYNDRLKFFYFKYNIKNINEFKNRKLILFAGIGNPENFFELLKNNHLNIVKEISFPDHYNYTQKDLDDLLLLEKKFNAKLVTTEKDFLRISSYQRRSFGVVPIKLQIENEDQFLNTIKKFIK